MLKRDEPHEQITSVNELKQTEEVLLKWPFPLEAYPDSTCFFRATVTPVEDVPGANADTYMPNLQMKPTIQLDEGYMRHVEATDGKVSVEAMREYLNMRIKEYVRITNNN